MPYKKNKKAKKVYGGYIEPPTKITPDYSVKNPTVSIDDSGSPYQRANNQLQSNTKNQANINQQLNGNSTNKPSGGGRKTKNKKKSQKNKSKKYKNKYFFILLR